MKIRRTWFVAMTSALSMSMPIVGGVALSEDKAKVEAIPADNSKVNQRDEQAVEKTATDQGSSSRDVEITRKIRRSITSNSKLSTYAHNIKIITINGLVTLKGPVNSVKEKEQVVALAKAVAGDAKVNNELDVSK